MSPGEILERGQTKVKSGDLTGAKELFNQLIDDYPDVSETSIAEQELKKIAHGIYGESVRNDLGFSKNKLFITVCLFTPAVLQFMVPGVTDPVRLISAVISMGIAILGISVIPAFIVGGIYRMVKKTRMPGFSVLLWISYGVLALGYLNMLHKSQ
jgi:hypothetical protein